MKISGKRLFFHVLKCKGCHCKKVVYKHLDLTILSWTASSQGEIPQRLQLAGYRLKIFNLMFHLC